METYILYYFPITTGKNLLGAKKPEAKENSDSSTMDDVDDTRSKFPIIPHFNAMGPRSPAFNSRLMPLIF